MPKKFKPPPFNYCDYRCDRCAEQENCRVFKDDQERLLQHYTKGEDPYDPEIFSNDLKQIFDKTKDMIKDMAIEQGINIDEAGDEEVSQQNPADYLVYRLAIEYYKTAHKFISELQNQGIPENMTENLEDLVWYHTLIAAKVGRLVSGFMDDYDEELQKTEEEGTLSVINKGVGLSQKALENMLNELPDQFHSIANLLDLLRRLVTQLKTDIRQKTSEQS